MALADFPQNLRLLCSYGKSVSAICRQVGINRHQLKRYLSGSTAPSLHTLRRLCDFFGLEENEILMRHADFAALIRIRPPQLHRSRDRVAEFFGAVADAADLSRARHYVGFYHVYFQPDRQVPEIHRALTQIQLEDRCLVTKTIERYPGGTPGLPPVVKYEGIAYPNRNRLTIIERRPKATDTAFFSILYGADSEDFSMLSGLSMGVAPDSSRGIYCVRLCWQYLGIDIDIRRALSQCGQFASDDPGIDRHIQHYTHNELAAGDFAFMPRY